MTFDPHPPRVVRPDKAPPLLMTKAQRLEASAAGVQGVAVVRFTPELSQWDPEMFVRTVLVEWLHVAEVWVGANFLFGRDRAGNFSMLRALGARYGFRAEKIDPVRYKEFVVSSTRIRRLIGEGRVDEAGALLGHTYAIDGTVVAATGGDDTGFPTANLVHGQRADPPARRVRDDGAAGRGNLSLDHEHRRPSDIRRPGAHGHRDARAGVERDLYGRSVRVGFVQRLRDERGSTASISCARRSRPTCWGARALRSHVAVIDVPLR